MIPSIFVWNFQGCASPKFACIVREYFVDFEIDVAAFHKTKVSGPKANEIISKIGLDCSHGIEARGFTGDLWICWKNSIHIQIIHNDSQFVHCRLGKKLSSTNILVQLFMVFQINRNVKYCEIGWILFPAPLKSLGS